MLSEFQIKLEKQSLYNEYLKNSDISTHLIPFKLYSIAGINVTISIQLVNKTSLYVYYGVGLTDIVDEITLKATASILNKNDNKCRVTHFEHLYKDKETQIWGISVHSFPTFASLEHYIHNDHLTINIEINDLIRKPVDRVLLERIYRATNSQEQVLMEKRLRQQESCNDNQAKKIKLLHDKINELNTDLENCKKKMKLTNSSSESSSSESSSSESSTTNKINLSILNDEKLNELQESILHEKKKRDTCVICLDQKINITFIPCGHRKTCKQCSEKMGNDSICPICRVQIEKKIQTY